MKRRKGSLLPPGYMDALGKLYGKQPIAGPETALESTQTTGVLLIAQVTQKEAGKWLRILAACGAWRIYYPPMMEINMMIYLKFAQ